MAYRVTLDRWEGHECSIAHDLKGVAAGGLASRRIERSVTFGPNCFRNRWDIVLEHG